VRRGRTRKSPLHLPALLRLEFRAGAELGSGHIQKT